jgi:hypothetical protein
MGRIDGPLILRFGATSGRAIFSGFDRQVSPDFRFRLTGSVYSDHSANSNTLFGGDRTGSHYFDVMENPNVAKGTVLSDENDYSPFSGRYNPGFSEDVNTFMINPFLK